MAKYKNISGERLVIVGVGIIEVDEEREMPEDFSNSNFKLVEEKSEEVENDNQINIKKKNDIFSRAKLLGD